MMFHDILGNIERSENTIFESLEVIFFQKLPMSETLKSISLQYFECDPSLMTTI